MNLTKHLGFIFLCAILYACGGGGGGGGSSAPQAPSISTGTFVDSPVMGVQYETATQSGITNSAGEFSYIEGETVTFSLGGIELGTAPADEEVTPLDLLGAEDMDDAISKGVADQLVNMLVFLQSLDRDHNPDNGIDLGDLNTTLADEVLDFDQPTELFQESTYKKLVNENEGIYVSVEQAQKHFTEGLGLSYTVELPSVDYLDTNADGETDNVISYSYDDSGRLIEIVEAPDTSDNASSNPTAITTLEYGPDGRLERLFYDDAENQMRLLTREYTYDSMGRLISQNETGVDDILLREDSWEYDEVGNILSYEYSLTPSGISSHTLNQNPYDLFFNLEGYDPNADIQIPLPSIFSSELPDGIGQFAGGGEASVISVYEDDGELASMAESYAFYLQSDILVEISINTIYDHGKKQSSSSQGEIEFYQLAFASEIVINRAEDDSITSCDFTSSSNSDMTQLLVSVDDELGDMTTYTCGDTGFEETVVTRSPDGNIESIIYRFYGDPLQVEQTEQELVYENGRVIEVLIEESTPSTVDQNNDGILENQGAGSILVTVMSSRQYTYTESGKLASISESTYSDAFKTWTREYKEVVIEP